MPDSEALVDVADGPVASSHAVGRGEKGLRWMEVPKKGQIYSPRFAHSATVLDGIVYVFGGDTGFFYTNVKLLNDLYAYDSATQNWRRLTPQENGPVPVSRCGHTLVAHEGRLILFAGSGPDHKALNDVWFYHPSKNLWEQVETHGAIPAARLFHTSVIYNNAMYVFGGLDGDDDIWRLDLTSKQWQKQPLGEEMTVIRPGRPGPRWMHTAAVWRDYMYLFGGEITGGRTTSELWQFNFSCAQWTKLEPPTVTGTPPGSRAFHASVLLKNKWIIHAGRNDQAGKLGDAYEFLFAKHEWRRVSTMLAPWCQCARWGHQIVFVPSTKAFIVTGGVTIEVLVLL